MQMKHTTATRTCRLLLLLPLCLLLALSAEPLPKPKPNIPPMPRMQPSVITAAGQRLLLGHVDVEVRYDADTKSVRTNKPGWWLINYPVNRIKGLEGKSDGEIAELLFDAKTLPRNWYFHSAGKAPPEPPAPVRPAPIELTPEPTLVVNQRHPSASEENPGTAERPLRTISAAIAEIEAGAVIHVYAGIYREALKVEKSGTPEKPIRIEGVRDAGGRMPVISGNDVFPPDSWISVRDLPGVYRAPVFTGRLGTVSAEGITLIERSLPGELKPGEYCLNRASDEFLNLRFDGDLEAAPGQERGDLAWRLIEADAEGYLDFGKAYGESAANAVFWATTWVWLEPKEERKEVWDPRFPQPLTGRLSTGGRFRANRETGSHMGFNKYRVWVNGQLLPSVIYATKHSHPKLGPRPKRTYGASDTWEAFPLKEGWNHLVFQWDTTNWPKSTVFKMGLPKGVSSAITSVAKPTDLSKRGGGKPAAYVSQYLVLGPFPVKKNPTVFVRLPGDAHPGRVTVDLAKRTGPLVEIEADFVHFRGFEVRHGAQFQQRGQVKLNGEGLLLEGCLLRDSEFRGLTLVPQKDQSAAPIVVRGNWILNPGNLGIGASCKSDLLTPENQDGLAPGRTRVHIEYNHIENHNWSGIPAMWESGAMKLFRLTGSVIRYNTMVGGNGPGIWLDWEHYNNRVEGNRYIEGWGLCVGIEASAGPHLVANNLATNMRPGPVWFRHMVLAWSSDRIWAVNNTYDGHHSTTNLWLDRIGVGGIYLDEGNDDRRTRWGSLAPRSYGIFNNLLLRCQPGIRIFRPEVSQIQQAANFHLDTTADYLAGKGLEKAGKPNPFRLAAPVNYERGDYRLPPDSELSSAGVRNETTDLVRHDFHGLLRFEDDPQSVGAFRTPPKLPADGKTLIEAEYEDGSTERWVK